jgi:hypothetical protein
MTPEQAIHELISTEATVPVIVAEQDEAPPARPYIALTLRGSTSLPLHLGPVASDGVRAVSSHRDARIELTYFGAGGMNAMETLAQRLQMERALLHAEALDLAVFSIGEVQQVSLLQEDGTYEPRMQLALSVRYTVTLDEEIAVIETVNVDGTETTGLAPDH